MTAINFSLKGKIVDVVSKQIINGELQVENGKITSIRPIREECLNYILPGLIDAHMHIESTLLIPSRFAEQVVGHGTLGLVADPHEIANVLGEIGVDFMINDAKKVPLEIRFTIPSCVPATKFETSGFVLNENIVESLLKRDEIVGLAEVMDYPGVINDDVELLRKIQACKRNGKKVDGHAPGLRGNELKKYASAGISTDHECSTKEEALEKIALGMIILIREGSAAKDFDALSDLFFSNPDRLMLCTDDLHPDDMKEKGHINHLIKRGLQKGIDLFDLLRAASYHPVHHYNLDLGLLQKGDSADFIVIDSPESFQVKKVYRKGECIFENQQANFSSSNEILLNNFGRKNIQAEEIQVVDRNKKINCILAKDGELLTDLIQVNPKAENDLIVSDLENDILKMVVMSRYDNSPPSVGFVKGFSFQRGAIAESIAHDSHNIIAIGCSDEEILKAINGLIEQKGGLYAVNGNKKEALPLELAGLMSNRSGDELLQEYEKITKFVAQLGSDFHSPFLTLAFMSLLVIPKIKLSDKGLFDVEKFKFIDLFTS